MGQAAKVDSHTGARLLICCTSFEINHVSASNLLFAELDLIVAWIVVFDLIRRDALFFSGGAPSSLKTSPACF